MVTKAALNNQSKATMIGQWIDSEKRVTVETGQRLCADYGTLRCPAVMQDSITLA